MGNKTNVSVDISEEVIKEAVQKEVQAGIVRALGNPEAVVRDAIKTMTNKYVDDRGKFCEKGSYQAKPYYEWLAEQTVVDCVKEEIEKYVEENKKALRKEIRKQFDEKDFRKMLAAQFLKTITGALENEWRMPINVSFDRQEEGML